MIFLGIDDTDMPGTPGTNQLARRLAAVLPGGFTCSMILRHQLLDDPRVPCTSRNGSASLAIMHQTGREPDELLPLVRDTMREWLVPGSDPGFCLGTVVPAMVTAFGLRCQRELVTREEARALGREAGLRLEGLGGTEGGVIGALAAVGLLAGGNDGRVVHLPGWTWPDTFAGWQHYEDVKERGVEEVRTGEGDTTVFAGMIHIGKHLRPNYRDGRVVLFVEPAGEGRWRAVRKL